MTRGAPSMFLGAPVVNLAATVSRIAIATRHAVRPGLVIAGCMLIAANLRPPLTSVGPLVGDIRADTGMSSAAAGLVTTLPLLAFAGVSPWAARIARRIGIERALQAALVVLVAGELVRSAGNGAGPAAGHRGARIGDRGGQRADPRARQAGLLRARRPDDERLPDDDGGHGRRGGRHQRAARRQRAGLAAARSPAGRRSACWRSWSGGRSRAAPTTSRPSRRARRCACAARRWPGRSRCSWACSRSSSTA